jgi:RNA polymerase sigma-70 factor (sigma-E family)
VDDLRIYAPAQRAPAPAPAPDAGLDLREVEREAEVTRLFDGHHRQLVRLAALLGAGADAEDVVAEAFCDLHRRWNRLRDPAKAVPYLRAAVCNLVRMRQRHLAVVRRHPEPLPPDASSAEYEAEVREEHREVAEALRCLPDRQRQALVLRYWLDLGEREVAEAMGISPGAVKSHTARGMAALARALEARR